MKHFKEDKEKLHRQQVKLLRLHNQDRYYNSQMYPTFGKTKKNIEPIFNKL